MSLYEWLNILVPGLIGLALVIVAVITLIRQWRKEREELILQEQRKRENRMN